MLGINYQLNVKGYCIFLGNKIDLDFNLDNTSVNKGCQNHFQHMSALNHATEYDVHVKGFISIEGVRIDVDKDFNNEERKGVDNKCTVLQQLINNFVFHHNV